MKKFGKKIDSMLWSVRVKAHTVKEKAVNALKSEDGDTNFLSIIIILAIVLLLAIAFIAFKDKILQLIEDAWKSFAEAFGGQKTNDPGNVTMPT